MSNIELYIKQTSFNTDICLPFSKSESNRLLIIQALSEGKISLLNLSDANDTIILSAALSSDKLNVDIQDAGTAARFFVTYACIDNKHKIITGSRRMQERPIEPLVNALKQIGFRIGYLHQNGFLPVEIIPTNLNNLGSEVSITGKVSSQFISALMLVGWKLQKGLVINIVDEYTSYDYINLTQKLMQKCSLSVNISGNKIKIPAQQIDEKSVSVSADWTNASYWYSFVALSENGKISISNLDYRSAQGDKAIIEFGRQLGVETILNGNYTMLTKKKTIEFDKLHFDFKNNPDLAQTIIVLCAAKNVKATFSGLQTLKIKETDRIGALQNELLKFGINLVEKSNDLFALKGEFKFSESVFINTYQDHRMAMAFAPLALLNTLIIEASEVVNKSYPKFWEEVEKLKN
jgi:3-phosphoshikimate 1-carboxyvinyltransferase